MKTCKSCGIEYDDNMFGISKGRNGEVYLRGNCKNCENAKRRKREKTNTLNTFSTTQNKTIEKEFNMGNTKFTDKEILEVVLNKKDRSHTVLNLDKDIRDNLKKMGSDKNLNLSDVANLIFKKFFDL